MTEAADRVAVPVGPQATFGLKRWRRWLIPVVAGLIVVAAGIGVWSVVPRSPADGSASVGFARDMSVHHQQAVEMAQAIRDRTEDPRIRGLADDILLTQQAQIGQMRGWLDAWGRAPTGSGPRMAWMGDGMDGAMPGMASREELTQLRQLSGREADREFLRLMIRHHSGAIPMAESAIRLADREVVRRLARSIVEGQQAEMAYMASLLEETGSSLPPTDPMQHPAMGTPTASDRP